MKKKLLTSLLLGVCLAFAGCGASNSKEGDTTEAVSAEKVIDEPPVEEDETASPEDAESEDVLDITYTDALGNEVVLTAEEVASIRSDEANVAVLSGSFAEIWTVAGGRLAATTEDAYDDTRNIGIDDNTVNLGSLNTPNLETIAAAEIDLAILSADLEDEVALRNQLEQLGIKTIYFSVETFEDYLGMLEFCTKLTGCPENYKTYGTDVRTMIDEQIARQDDSHPTVLFVRAYSTGAKAKGSDSMTGIMLDDLGCVNIADGNAALGDDLSMEIIVAEDPDYIFVTTMGSDSEAAMNSVATLLTDNPAWESLTAVQNDNYYVIPKEMFHNKPNQRWGEAYKMLADILYPDTNE